MTWTDNVVLYALVILLANLCLWVRFLIVRAPQVVRLILHALLTAILFWGLFYS